MSIDRWQPREELNRQEQALMKRLDRVRKLFGFLRVHRRQLFNDTFQDELATMYRNTGAGKPPVPPALMAMAALVQAYLGVSDAEMVELTVVDLRVQMILDRLEEDAPAFSQGALVDFRDLLIRADMDRRLLERTVELARETGGFDARKLPRSLRVAVDSSPFEGAAVQMRRCSALALVAAMLRTASAEPEEPTPAVLQRSFIAIGWGLVHSVDAPPGRERSGSAFRLGFGQALTETLSLFEELTGVVPVDGDDAVEHVDLGLGLQWAPFTPYRYCGLLAALVDPHAVFLKAGGGITFRDGSKDDPSAYGPVFSAAFGYAPLQGADYALGIEFRGVVAILDGETTTSVEALLNVHLAR